MIIIIILKGKQFEFSIPRIINIPLDREIWIDDTKTPADSAIKDYWQKKVNVRLLHIINTIIKTK